MTRWPLIILVAFAPSDRETPLTAATITYRATDFAFTGPDTVAAGVTTVRLVNAGREGHQLNFYRLTAEADAGEVMRTLIANTARPRGTVKMGGVESVEAGQTDSVIVSLAPGRYVIVCGLPSSDDTPHASKGMLKLLVVRGETRGVAAPAPLPPAQITARLSEYAFTFSTPLRAGPQRIRVENVGRQAHHLILTRLHPGKTMADADAWDGKSPAPFDNLGGVAALDPGQANVWDVTLAPGTYVLACVILDAADKKPHYEHGMQKEVRIAARR
jgi:uncharacterized cupredoxin-like copper-binding protein